MQFNRASQQRFCAEVNEEFGVDPLPLIRALEHELERPEAYSDVRGLWIGGISAFPGYPMHPARPLPQEAPRASSLALALLVLSDHRDRRFGAWSAIAGDFDACVASGDRLAALQGSLVGRIEEIDTALQGLENYPRTSTEAVRAEREALAAAHMALGGALEALALIGGGVRARGFGTPQRGRPELRELADAEHTLHINGFKDVEIAELLIDNATERSRAARRVGDRRRRRESRRSEP